MKGSLALWCKKAGDSVDGHSPSLELHFNYWQANTGKKSTDALDMGVLIHDLRVFDEIKIYFPGKIDRKNILDLSSELHDRKTLSAVFNDTLEVGNDHTYCEDEKKKICFQAKSGDTVRFHVMRMNVERDIRIMPIEETDGQEGTLITIENSFLRKFKEIGEHYFRVRFLLDSESLTKLFRDKINPKDQIFSSTFLSLDTLEFRLNERRNFGEKLREEYENGSVPDIRAVHYFLIRDINTELVRAHAEYRKMRKLEPNLWDGYVQRIGDVSPNEMVIYHWRAQASEKSGNVQDFIAYAAFRQPNSLGPIPVASFVIALGSLGSGVFSLFYYLIQRLRSIDPIAVEANKQSFYTSLCATLIALALHVHYIFGQRSCTFLSFCVRSYLERLGHNFGVDFPN
nr:hypothetical protein [uncultured Cohaesibacter sp.]